jgi:hypothetical protein
MSSRSSSFTLLHPCGLHIRSDMPESEAASVPGVSARDMKTGYVWCDLPDGTIAGDDIAMSICLYMGTLYMLTIAVVDPRFGSEWSDWSEAKEQARTAATGDWLARVGYQPGRYSWGEVWAEFDGKSGGGGGGVRFAGVGLRRG